jgi:single-strand DNA-binding protein
MDNTVTLAGNLTRDPELRYTTTGRGVASVGLAVNRRWQSNGEWQEEVSFFNLVIWGELGEHVAETCEKGSRVLVTGRLQQRQYETKEGESRSTVELVVDDIGPSLKWATATVQRIHRDEHESKPKEKAPDPVYGDEEPF